MTGTGTCARRLAPLAIALVLALTSCQDPQRTPPPLQRFADLPVSGTLADARRDGFTACVASNTAMRCRREGVRFEGQGPFSAAVDLPGADGSGGFDHLVLWHQTDQSALIAVVDRLRKAGWSKCLNPLGSRWADQAIYWQQGAPVFLSLDRSYWSSRRLMVYSATGTSLPRCGT